ncbi:MAG: hypothetical protein GC204_03220 [Chloroflexi bacterium]|nr:hypothetical protein [Chloroflexota bacterium]
MIDAAQVKELVIEQLASIEDEIVRAAIERLLIEPFSQDRYWFPGSETFVCWVVADDPESDTYYVYCEDDFGLPSVWGIVLTSTLELGMDSNWFGTLERAFYDSFASMPLAIWNVVKFNTPEKDRIIASSLTNTQASELIAKLNAEQNLPPNIWSIYSVEPRTKSE